MNKTIVAAQESGEQIGRIAKQRRCAAIDKNNANRIISDALLRAEKVEFDASGFEKYIRI